jgi:allantoin racemase
VRINFINPFGTDAYNNLIATVLQHSARQGTEMMITHLEAGPRNLDYYAPKQLVQVEILKAVVAAEQAGFDAVIIGCCYDPALTEARELVSIPVVGPLEASVALARPFGHRYAVVTDHHKAVPEIQDRLRLYGMDANCTAVTSVGWFVDDMVTNTDAVAQDAYRVATDLMASTGAETVIIGCTIVAACYELAAMQGDNKLATASVMNPNVMAVKQAELLVDLAAADQYRISRRGYYQHLREHDPVEAADIDLLLGAIAPVQHLVEGR